MKKTIVAAALATVLSAAPAFAAVPANSTFILSQNNNTVATGYTSLITFDSDGSASPTFNQSAGQNIVYDRSGNAGRMDASGNSPYGNSPTYYFLAPSPQTGGFYGVGGRVTNSNGTTTDSFATFMGSATNTGFSSISVYLGSLNSFNVVKLCYDASCSNFETYDGLQLNNGIDPNSGVNTRATFNALNGTTFSGIQFYNNGQGAQGSFEFDNLAFYKTATGAVPEPATWAMMIAGFGLVGGAMRRRRSAGSLAAA